MNKTITQKQLKEQLHYSQSSGIFTRRISNINHVKVGDIAGSIQNTGYIKICVNSKKYFSHRLAWLYVYGEFPKSQIDHINHNKVDNRISNLREATPHINSRNMSRRLDNTSGVVGVAWNKNANKWQSRISTHKKSIHLGYFIEFHEAVNARKNAEVMLGYHVNHGKHYNEV